MFSITRLVALASLALAVSAAPSPAADAVAATCNNAYNGLSPTKLGPGVVYTCSKVSYVITSYVCYVGSGPRYCCSGDLVSTSAGPMVGGCNAI